MDMIQPPFPPRKTRLGFHYFPDLLHYTESDLQTWLPELKALGASWLVLQSPAGRAIPEYFIKGLVESGIEPIVQFNLPLIAPPDIAGLRPLLAAYAHWGIHGVQWFERPNARSAWPASGWAQQGLVERFLDRFLPLGNLALQNGMSPILPPLEPGGSYWDTAFLRSTLESLDRRKQTVLLQKLVLSAFGWTGGRSLNWGAGGPARWPEARPYRSADKQQDQRGFRIFDWYGAIARAVLGKPCPILMLGVGVEQDPMAEPVQPVNPSDHYQANLAVANLLSGEPAYDPQDPDTLLEPIPAEVLACNFWLLAADAGSQHQPQAWYAAEGPNLPVVASMKVWAAQVREYQASAEAKTIPLGRDFTRENTTSAHPIRHYLLLPTYEFGVADWHLNVIRPFVKKYRPTVGFSLAEAAMAARVTVLGDPQAIPDEMLEKLRQSGSMVERINGDGTSIATQLAER